jgi:hypothetical protein
MPHPGVAQAGGRAGYLAQRAGEAERALVAADPDALRVTGRGVGQDLRDGPGRRQVRPARRSRPARRGQDDLAARWSRQLCCGVKPSSAWARSMASSVPNSPTSRVSVTPGKTSASSAADGRSITVSAAAMM